MKEKLIKALKPLTTKHYMKDNKRYFDVVDLDVVIDKIMIVINKTK